MAVRTFNSISKPFFSSPWGESPQFVDIHGHKTYRCDHHVEASTVLSITGNPCKLYNIRTSPLTEPPRDRNEYRWMCDKQVHQVHKWSASSLVIRTGKSIPDTPTHPTKFKINSILSIPHLPPLNNFCCPKGPRHT